MKRVVRSTIEAETFGFIEGVEAGIFWEYSVGGKLLVVKNCL